MFSVTINLSVLCCLTIHGITLNSGKKLVLLCKYEIMINWCSKKREKEQKMYNANWSAPSPSGLGEGEGNKTLTFWLCVQLFNLRGASVESITGIEFDRMPSDSMTEYHYYILVSTPGWVCLPQCFSSCGFPGLFWKPLV